MPSPGEFLVPALDGLVHLGAFILLAVLLIISIKIPTRGNAQTGFINAIIVVALAALVRAFCSMNVASWIPELGSQIQFIAVIGITFIVTILLVIWRFALPILTTLFSSIATTAGLFAHVIYVPQISEKYLPEGPTFAEFVGMASDTIKESEKAAKELAAMMNQGKELEKDKAGAFATALAAIAQLTSDDEWASLQNDFNAGVEFWRERKELMDAMTPEEKEAYKREMAAFLQENGLSEDRYSLAALKDVKKEDLANAASFMKGLDSEFGGTAQPMDEQQLASASDSLAKIASNIKGGKLDRLEKDSIGKLIEVLSNDGVDAAIAQTKQEMDELVGGSQISGAFLATLMELKSGISASTIITESQIYQAKKKQAASGSKESDELITPTPDSPEEDQPDIIRRSVESKGAASGSAPDLSRAEIPEWAIPEGMEAVSTQRDLCMILIPESMPRKKDWIKVAERIAVTGFVVSGEQGQDVRAIIGKTTIGMSDKIAIRNDNKAYTFKVTEILYSRLYLTAISAD